MDDFGVPPELRDWDASWWRDPDEFVRWVGANLPAEQVAREFLSGPNDHGRRFDFALIHWALQNGFRHPRYPNSLDPNRMRSADLSLMPALERVRRRTVLKDY